MVEISKRESAGEVIKRKEFNEDGKEVRTELASPPPSSVRAQNVVQQVENGREEVVQKKVTDEKLAAHMWNELECPICRDHFTSPRVLPCLHVYCECCLAQAAGSNSYVVCPICRKEVALINGDVKNFPKHNMIENLIRILTLNKEKDNKLCDGCGNRGAEFWCVEAEEAYCKDCKSIYSSLKYTKDHHIFNFDELIKDRSLQANHRIQLCSKHPEETLRLYCETTNECICRDCTLGEYKNMKVKPISEIIGSHRDNVKVALDAVQSKLKPLNQSISILKDEEHEMKEQAKKAQNDIKTMIERVMKSIKNREQHLLNTVEQMKQASVSQLEAKREELTVAMQSTQAGCDFVDNLLNDGSDVDILGMEAQIYERMEELKNVDLDIGVKRKNIEFQKVNETIITTFIDGLGKFVVETYNAQPIKEMRERTSTGRQGASSHAATSHGRPISPGEFSTLRSAVDGDEDHAKGFGEGMGDNITDHYVGKGVRAIGAQGCKPGTGVCEFKKPMGISFDKSGNMFVADTENNRVQCLKKSGVFSHIIGAGKQGSGKGELSNPTDTAVDSQGFLYVVDSGNSRLSVFTTQGKFVKTIGSEGKLEGQFNNPRKICITKDNYLIVTDSDNNRVQIFDSRGNFLRVIGGDDYNDPKGRLHQPVGVCCDSHGLIYVTQMKPAEIKIYAFDGGYIGHFGKEGKGKGELLGPSDITVDAQGGIIVSEWGNCRISIFDERGHYHGKYGVRGKKYGQFDGPCCVELNQDGRLIVVDTWNHRIQIL